MPFPQGIRVAGNPNPIPFDTEIEISTTNGNNTTVTYKGETSQMLSAFPNLIVGSQEAIFKQDGAVSTVQVRRRQIPGGVAEVPFDTIEMSFNEVQKSIFFNPTYAQISAERIKQIEKGVATARDPDNDDTISGIAADLGLNGVETDALALIVEGTDTFTWFEPVLVYTRNVSLAFPEKMPVLDVGQIFATEDLPIPLGLLTLFDMPIAVSTLGIRPGYALAWLKTARMNTTPDGGGQLIQQFTYGVYELTLYFGGHD